MPFIMGKTAGGGASRPAAAAGAFALITLLGGCADGSSPGASMFGGARPSDLAATGANSTEISLAAGDSAARGE